MGTNTRVARKVTPLIILYLRDFQQRVGCDFSRVLAAEYGTVQESVCGLSHVAPPDYRVVVVPAQSIAIHASSDCILPHHRTCSSMSRSADLI